MPRSLVACYDDLARYLEALAGAYGTRGECHRLIGQMHARLRYGRIDDVFRQGLHEFLTEFIEQNAVLGAEISRHYLS
jgi:uncharacterized alpha-E superfamily protein